MEGPEPDGVRELLDAAQGVPNMTAEQRARMRARLRTAIEEDDRAWTRRRTMTRVGIGAVAVLAVAAGVALAVRSSQAPAPLRAKPMPADSSTIPEDPAEPVFGLAPPQALGDFAEPEDAGRVRQPVPQ
jgi:hypothetical protein